MAVQTSLDKVSNSKVFGMELFCSSLRKDIRKTGFGFTDNEL